MTTAFHRRKLSSSSSVTKSKQSIDLPALITVKGPLKRSLAPGLCFLWPEHSLVSRFPPADAHTLPEPQDFLPLSQREQPLWLLQSSLGTNSCLWVSAAEQKHNQTLSAQVIVGAAPHTLQLSSFPQHKLCR